MDRKLRYVCLSSSITDIEGHCAIVGKNSIDRAEMNVLESSEVDAIAVFRDVVQVLSGSYRHHSLRSSFP